MLKDYKMVRFSKFKTNNIHCNHLVLCSKIKTLVTVKHLVLCSKIKTLVTVKEPIAKYSLLFT